MNDSRAHGYLPVLTYYQLYYTLPHDGQYDTDWEFNNLNNPATMAAYYADFQLLLQKAAAFGGPVVVHVEPDFWGYMQLRVVGIDHGVEHARDCPATLHLVCVGHGLRRVAHAPTRVA